MVAKVFEKDQIDIYQQAIDAEKCSGNGLAEFICPGFFCSSRIVFGVRYSSHLWYTDYNLYHNVLIKKLEQMVSKYEALKLQRQVYVTGRIKTMNESIYLERR